MATLVLASGGMCPISVAVSRPVADQRSPRVLRRPWPAPHLIGNTMPCSAARDPGVPAASRAERADCMIAVLTGDLDIVSAPALREEFLGLLRPGASRLIVDLSAAGFADASGAAVLVGTGRRAGLLGGWLRLVSPAPGLVRVLSVTGLDRHLAIFATADEAMTGVPAGRARIRPVPPAITRAKPAADSGELRGEVGALLGNSDAWGDTAGHLRRLLYPDSRPAAC